MQCELCNKNDASIHFKQITNGVAKEMFVCAECAEKNGFDVHSPMSMTDFLFGAQVQPQDAEPGEDPVCDVCHMHRSDFRKTSRLGCPECYVAFEGDLMPVLTAMHKGGQHVGKVPPGEQVSAELRALRRALDEAVADQRFEEAARLRDQIRDREAGCKTGGSAT